MFHRHNHLVIKRYLTYIETTISTPFMTEVSVLFCTGVQSEER